MEDGPVKDEEVVTVSALTDKADVPTNENQSIPEKQDKSEKPKGESRNEGFAVKREDSGDERDEPTVVPSMSTLKKKSSPSQPNRSRNFLTNGSGIPNPNISKKSGRFNPVNHPPSLPGQRPPFPMGRGYGGPPPPYGYPSSGGFHGPPHPHAYPPPHMLQHLHAAAAGQYAMKGGFSHHHAMAVAYGAHSGQPGPGHYGLPYPPHHPGMNPNFSHNQMNTSSDSNSISSMNSLNSKKKRTIDGLHTNSNLGFNPYAFRRTEDSNSSTTSTLTAGNNTSTENADEDLQSNASMVFRPKSGRPESRPHRRTNSGTSTASSLSAGGFSLSSYGERGDAMAVDNKKSPKRQKKTGLMVDTSTSLLQPMDGHDQDQSSRFEQLSLGAKQPTSTDSASSAGNSNLFLSLSTSPINATDIDSTPNMKNTKDDRSDRESKSAMFKIEDKDRPSDTPTPPVHGELGDSEMLNDEHSMLHRHLRGQSFTPLPHMSERHTAESSSPSNAASSSLQPQLSWSIAGDTPSLGDLADWEDSSEKHLKMDSTKNRPGSTTSTDSRTMAISPHDFQLWKEEHDQLAERNVSGTTTPLPVFFEQSGQEGAENRSGDGNNKSSRRPDETTSSQGGQKREQSFWKSDSSSGLPPTPMFGNSEFRDELFPGHSPMQGDRRDHMDNNFNMFHPHGERIRNLRGRVPPGGHLPPMPLHIPPHMSSHHLPMTSPMGLGPAKAGLWSPHGLGHLSSPHGIGSPLSNMAQSKRKCIPLKPPIPSKFQGDMEKLKGAPVPEFTSLVNFPSHMSQKQAVNLPDGMRCCVMCGQACTCSNKQSKKGKGKGTEGGLAPRNANGQDNSGDKGTGYAIIPTQNKGLCTLCDVNVWVVSSTGLEIKWCKGCKNFRPWAAFGDKGLATKCLRCRERQREKYALQKEEKEKARLVAKSKNK